MSAALLSAAQIAFIQGNVTMYAATAGDGAHPHVTRATGARVDTDSHAVTVFVSATEAGALLADVRAGGALAVVFCEPGSEKAIQLKSDGADILQLQRDDPQLIADYCERLIRHIVPLGFSPQMLRSFFARPLGDAIALRFLPCAAFDQTPGPNAGAALTS